VIVFVAGEVSEAILAVLLHHGGRVEDEALKAIFGSLGCPGVVFFEGRARLIAADMILELGGRWHLARAGWARIADGSESLEELVGRRVA
jgi:hypothetical protein